MTIDKPEIVIFDYGKTLGTSDGFDFTRGISALWEHAVSNPHNVTAEQTEKFVRELYEKLDVHRKAGCEIPQINEMRLAYEYLGIEFDVTYPELERIFRDSGSAARAVPGAAEFLRELHSIGIRSGVISNLNWSGKLLKERIYGLFPDNHFEFIIATSEYVVRKPDRMIFELALRKADVPREKAWYVGDDIEADIIGAHSAGIFPVWLSYGREPCGLGFDHLTAESMSALVEIIRKFAETSQRV